VLALTYPHDKLEILIASDGSDDETNAIVSGYADRGVKLLAFPRQGKIPALNAAATYATSEILAFSDANSMYKPDAMCTLIRPFADPTVGAVGGNQCYLSGGGGAASLGEQLYWSFDRRLKLMQGEAGNMIAATGAIHAIRRDLFQPVPLGVSDDFVISTRAISRGYRLVFEQDDVAYERIAPSDQAEFQRKVRVIVRGLRGLWVMKELFNPLRYGFYSVQLFSHKFLRWSAVWPLLVLFGVSPSLYRAGRLYRLITLGQVAFYGSALAVLSLRRTSLVRLKVFKPLVIPFYFCLANFAALRAWLQLLGGKRVDAWNSNRHVG
jgi:cellulose synthase/poly-beta-1,6-N-acetylglucosamine synthase-like glycosyltransferase